MKRIFVAAAASLALTACDESTTQSGGKDYEPCATYMFEAFAINQPVMGKVMEIAPPGTHPVDIAWMATAVFKEPDEVTWLSPELRAYVAENAARAQELDQLLIDNQCERFYDDPAFDRYVWSKF